jgi:hypothetical protein
MAYAHTNSEANASINSDDPSTKRDASDPGMITSVPPDHPSRQTMPAPEDIRRLTPNAPPTYPQPSESPPITNDNVHRRQPTKPNNAASSAQASQQDRISDRIGQDVQAYVQSQQPVFSALRGQGIRRLAPTAPPPTRWIQQ